MNDFYIELITLVGVGSVGLVLLVFSFGAFMEGRKTWAILYGFPGVIGLTICLGRLLEMSGVLQGIF